MLEIEQLAADAAWFKKRCENPSKHPGTYLRVQDKNDYIEHLLAIVITSYSIHYTKLYD